MEFLSFLCIVVLDSILMMMISFVVLLAVSIGSCVLVVIGHVAVTDVFVGLTVRGLFVFGVRVKRLGWVMGLVLCEGLGLF